MLIFSIDTQTVNGAIEDPTTGSIPVPPVTKPELPPQYKAPEAPTGGETDVTVPEPSTEIEVNTTHVSTLRQP